jgi:conjugal transfer pilus assembly protein TrbC
MPGDAALEQEMARQRMRSQELLRRADDSFRADPGRPVQSTPKLPGTLAAPGAGPDPMAVAERYRRAGAQEARGNAGPDLLVFVSFSMPEASLKRVAAEAGKADAVLVFRGPKDGSLKKTLQAFEPLARLGARAIIHPEAFTRHDVKSVPVYVLDSSPGGCEETAGACGDPLRLAGDVSLDYALERMALSRSPMGREAEARLNRLRGAR